MKFEQKTEARQKQSAVQGQRNSGAPEQPYNTVAKICSQFRVRNAVRKMQAEVLRPNRAVQLHDLTRKKLQINYILPQIDWHKC